MVSTPPRNYYSGNSEHPSLFYAPHQQTHHNPVLSNQWEASQHQQSYGLLTPPFEESSARQQGRFSTPPYNNDSYYQEHIPRSFTPQHHHQHHQLSQQKQSQPQQLQSPFPSPNNSNPSPRYSSPSTIPQQRHHSYSEEQSQNYFHLNESRTTYYSPSHQISPSYSESTHEGTHPPREDSDSPEAVAYRIDRPDTPSKPFISKLSHLLNHPKQYADIIHWNTAGTAFVVAITERFITEILPEVFSHNSITAFRRQLNTYGFNHLSNAQVEADFLPFRNSAVSARDLAAWTHPFFSRDDPINMNKLVPKPSRARRAHQSYKLAMMLEGRTGISLRSKVEEKKRRLMSLSEVGITSCSMAEEITESYLQEP